MGGPGSGRRKGGGGSKRSRTTGNKSIIPAKRKVASHVLNISRKTSFEGRGSIRPSKR